MKLNEMIDHTKLGPTVSKKDIEKLVNEAIEYDFKSVCVSPLWVSYAAKLLKNQKPLVCTVVGFPHGTHTKEVKAYETKDAILNGADEIDMVVNVSAVKAQDEKAVFEDIKAVVDAASGKTVKVIIETAYLTKEEIVLVCKQALKAKANFVKTSTGYASSGANKDDVKLMKETVKDALEVKASGGVRSFEDAMIMINAGATRIGTSNGIALINHEEAKEGY
ncbi:MAG: deoxyribose-phosphate aldolase [Candidatus Phytoplasma sp.]|nr:deoxyribose-phosphate aldolase [Phytoplasma sp.]